MHLLDYARVLRRRWLLVTAFAVLGIGAAIVVTIQTTPLYASAITLYVSSTDATPNASSAYDATLLAQQQVQSYASLLTSERVAKQVAAKLGDGSSPAVVQSKITASVIPQTALLRASVTDSSPLRAQRIASVLGPAFAGAVDDLERPESGAASPVRVSVVDDATLPVAPVSPRPVRNAGLGLLAGLLLGFAVAVLRETLDTTVKSGDELRELTGGPVLAMVGTQGKEQQALIRRHRSPYVESYRVLRTNLQFVKVDQPPKAVTVTSSLAGEGKSFTACSLALTLADAGKRVILVDADLRRPQICTYLGLTENGGLTSVLADKAGLEDVLVTSKNRMLSVLPCGPIPPNPSELLGSARMIALLEQLKERADMIVIDSPPLLPVVDAAILSHISDGALLVAMHGRVRRDQVSRSIEQLDAVGAKLLGNVLNRVPASGDAGAYGYYGHGAVPELTGIVGATITPLEAPGDVNIPIADTAACGARHVGAATATSGDAERLPGSRSGRSS